MYYFLAVSGFVVLSFVLVGIGCYCLGTPENEDPPNCHICGKECEEITAIPIEPNHSGLSVPYGAVWLCRGQHTGNYHKVIYYRRIEDQTDEKPQPFTEL